MNKTTAPCIVLTRPKAAAERFAKSLRAAQPKARVIISPVLEISYRKDVVLPQADRLVFTSVHGVEGYARLGGLALPAYCVGARTAETARVEGFTVLATAQNSDELVDMLRTREKSTLLHARGAFVAGDLSTNVKGLAEAVVYDQPVRMLTKEALQALSGETTVVLPLFSPRTAGELAKQNSLAAPLYAIFMSDSVKARFQGVDTEKSRVVDFASNEAMLEATLELFDAACALEGRALGD